MSMDRRPRRDRARSLSPRREAPPIGKTKKKQNDKRQLAHRTNNAARLCMGFMIR